MKKQDLLKLLDRELMDQLYGFCYRRCANSHEAEELCSEMLLAMVKAGNREGDVDNGQAFLWRIARNVYADYSERRRQTVEPVCFEDLAEAVGEPEVPEEDGGEEDARRLRQIWREISFLSKAYRDVMVLYYLEGMPTGSIAQKLGVSETAVRQRLFSARNSIRKEVTNMETKQTQTTKPMTLQELKLTVWGTGRPSDGDPRDVFQRQFSKHVVWLCRNRERTAKEISGQLNVPMPYVEEELDIQVRGTNGRYGFLRKMPNGKYTTNVVLLDEAEFARATEIYTKRIPAICNSIKAHIEENEAAYLAFPYINKKVDLNLILWQQISDMVYRFSGAVGKKLEQTYFPEISKASRPFTVFGFQNDADQFYGGGHDTTCAKNICGYTQVDLDNIYISRIKKHFHCGLNVAMDGQIQLALHAIHGLSVKELRETEQEDAAKAIECGYLYREGDLLYTKFLVCSAEDSGKLFELNKGLCARYEAEAEQVAAEMAEFLKSTLPAHLLPDYQHANTLGGLPVLDAVVEELIASGLLTPPENGLGAEGIWMSVRR